MKQMLRMSDNADILELKQETYRYSMQDGLDEIFVGLGLIIVAWIIESRDIRSYGFLSSPVIFILMIVFRTPILEKVRRKVTYPRIGYVKVHQDDPSPPVMVVLLFAITIIAAAPLALMVIPSDQFYYDTIWTLSLVSTGMVMIAASFSYVEKTGDRRYFAFGLLGMTTGLIFALLEFEPPKAGPVFYLLGWGVVITLVGLTTFIRFIHKYPIIDPDEVEASEQ